MKSLTEYQQEFYAWKTRTASLPNNASLGMVLDCKMDGVWLVLRLLGRASITALWVVAMLIFVQFVMLWKWLSGKKQTNNWEET